MSEFQVYLVFLADSLQTAVTIIWVVCLIAGALAFFHFSLEKDLDEFIKIRKYILIPFSCAFILSIFIPSSKTLASMYIIPKVENNENIPAIKIYGNELFNLTIDALKNLEKEK